MPGANDVKDLSESRILIVDDAKTNIDILVRRRDGAERRSRWRDLALRSVEEPADLVLDIVMPGIMLSAASFARRSRRGSCRHVPERPRDVKDKTRRFEVGGNGLPDQAVRVLEVKARVRSLLKAKATDAIREAMARDLRIAREIQMGILPADLDAATSGTGLDVHDREPAQKVGGDLYEVLRLRSAPRCRTGRRVGEGDPGGALHGRRRDDVHARPADRRPGRDSRPLNDELAEQNPRGMFVTMQCLCSTSSTAACLAAPDTTSSRSSRRTVRRAACPSSGRPAGLMAANQSQRELPLAPGETFVLFSDGVSRR